MIARYLKYSEKQNTEYYQAYYHNHWLYYVIMVVYPTVMCYTCISIDILLQTAIKNSTINRIEKKADKKPNHADKPKAKKKVKKVGTPIIDNPPPPPSHATIRITK